MVVVLVLFLAVSPSLSVCLFLCFLIAGTLRGGEQGWTVGLEDA